MCIAFIHSYRMSIRVRYSVGERSDISAVIVRAFVVFLSDQVIRVGKIVAPSDVCCACIAPTQVRRACFTQCKKYVPLHISSITVVEGGRVG